MNVCTIKAISYKLVTIQSFGFQKLWFNISRHLYKRIRVQIQFSCLFIINTLFLIYDILIKTYRNLTCI